MADLRFDDDLFDFPGAVDDEEESAESAVPDDDAASVGTERLALVRLPSPGKSEETGVRKALETNLLRTRSGAWARTCCTHLRWRRRPMCS